jgi:hypothetical protein
MISETLSRMANIGKARGLHTFFATQQMRRQGRPFPGRQHWSPENSRLQCKQQRSYWETCDVFSRNACPIEFSKAVPDHDHIAALNILLNAQGGIFAVLLIALDLPGRKAASAMVRCRGRPGCGETESLWRGIAALLYKSASLSFGSMTSANGVRRDSSCGLAAGRYWRYWEFPI